jgi:hypothetical protein
VVEDDRDVVAAPGLAHQLGLAGGRMLPRPARENDGSGSGRNALGVGDAVRADRVQDPVALAGVAEDRDDAHQRPRRR